MKDTFWLIMTKDGVRRMAKGRRRKWEPMERPELAKGEYAVAITVEVPASVFNPAALPSATIVIPEASVITPDVSVSVEPAPAIEPASDFAVDD